VKRKKSFILPVWRRVSSILIILSSHRDPLKPFGQLKPHTLRKSFIVSRETETNWNASCNIFYRAMLCIRGTSQGLVSVRLSVRSFVTSRCSTKTAKRRITKTTPHDSAGTLVFWCQRSPRNSTGITPTGAPNAGGVGHNWRLSTNNRLYLEKVQDRRMVHTLTR